MCLKTMLLALFVSVLASAQNGPGDSKTGTLAEHPESYYVVADCTVVSCKDESVKNNICEDYHPQFLFAVYQGEDRTKDFKGFMVSYYKTAFDSGEPPKTQVGRRFAYQVDVVAGLESLEVHPVGRSVSIAEFTIPYAEEGNTSEASMKMSSQIRASDPETQATFQLKCSTIENPGV